MAAAATAASLGLAACGSDSSSGGTTHLTWYINPDGGGSDPAGGGQAQLAKECSDASDGRYTIGIQLLPMPPVLAQGRLDEKRVRANVADASAGGTDTVFGDYLAMYLALAEPRRALAIGRGLPDSAIDDGNTRTYMLAWLLTARAGELRPLP